MSTLILGMIVRDEAPMLALTQPVMLGVIERRWAHVFGSSDGTRELLEACGWKTLNFNWQNDYAKARNALLEYNRGEGWMLQLDADECMTPTDLLRLVAFLPRCETDVIAFPRYNYTAEGLLYDIGSYPDLQARCIRLSSPHRWTRAVHEVIEAPQTRFDAYIHHYGWCKPPAANWLRSINYERITQGIPPYTEADIPEHIRRITFDEWLADMRARHKFAPVAHVHPLQGKL